jgi:hypothetical protein
LLKSAENMKAESWLARENLINSLMVGLATAKRFACSLHGWRGR